MNVHGGLSLRENDRHCGCGNAASYEVRQVDYGPRPCGRALWMLSKVVLSPGKGPQRKGPLRHSALRRGTALGVTQEVPVTGSLFSKGHRKRPSLRFWMVPGRVLGLAPFSLCRRPESPGILHAANEAHWLLSFVPPSPPLSLHLTLLFLPTWPPTLRASAGPCCHPVEE
ncbi:hypothetical protein DPEC_G00183470 [Dallia pectoralis]|uniref:Uncharacterized protein n=1 Tax=Dallia pectoralis TaxID=75939 RepID=A0ACC2GAQ8_DALPE|nr:hypothetical protein DPEC_G00183470 [Dallia pectoralis]